MKVNELFEGRDPAPEILKTVAAALRAIGFSKKSAKDTPGVKRQWLIQKKVKYDFKSEESFNSFMTDLKAHLPEIKGEKSPYKHVVYFKVTGKGFSIETQNEDTVGQVVLQVAKSNKAGQMFNMGYDT